MKVRNNRMAGAAMALALAGGLAVAAPAARAETPVSAAAQAHTQPRTGARAGKWHTIWQAEVKPRHSTWTSGEFGVHAYNATVKYRCWNGGDGTKAKASLVEADSPHRTRATHPYSTCNGSWWTFKTTKVKPNTPYQVVIQQNHGRTHTEQVGVYEYR